jgi:carbonic anhydrase/acetyltransferase-like protein (isoleucine patch superfamily)
MLRSDVVEYCRIAPDVLIGANVKISVFVGDNTRIGAFVEIQKGAAIGKNCKISSHTFICEGVTVQDNVFIGHNVTFINDKYPRATRADGSLQTEEDWSVVPTLVEKVQASASCVV